LIQKSSDPFYFYFLNQMLINLIPILSNFPLK